MQHDEVATILEATTSMGFLVINPTSSADAGRRGSFGAPHLRSRHVLLTEQISSSNFRYEALPSWSGAEFDRGSRRVWRASELIVLGQTLRPGL